MIIYNDLSGPTQLYARAYPNDHNAIRAAIMREAVHTQYYTDYQSGVYCWELEQEALDRAITPWRTRLQYQLGQDATLLNVHPYHVVLLRPGAEPSKEIAIGQYTLDSVLDDDIVLLRHTDNSVLVRRIVNPIGARRGRLVDDQYIEDGEYLHSELARELYHSASNIELTEFVRDKIRLIIGADGWRTSDVLPWLDVSEEITHTILTDNLSAGLGYAGQGRAMYHLRLRNGSERLVVEQIDSYSEGYAVQYDWVDYKPLGLFATPGKGEVRVTLTGGYETCGFYPHVIVHNYNRKLWPNDDEIFQDVMNRVSELKNIVNRF